MILRTKEAGVAVKRTRNTQTLPSGPPRRMRLGPVLLRRRLSPGVDQLLAVLAHDAWQAGSCQAEGVLLKKARR